MHLSGRWWAKIESGTDCHIRTHCKESHGKGGSLFGGVDFLFRLPLSDINGSPTLLYT